MRALILAVLCLAGAAFCFGQTTPVPAAIPPDAAVQDWNAKLLEGASQQVTSAEKEKTYHIGAEDLIEITVFEVPELSRTVRVSAGGDISLPLIGSVKAAGLSPVELEQSITEALRKSYVKDPQVTVFLKEYRSDPVSVVGAVKVPGLYQIQTQKSLIELLAMAQGFSENPKMLPGRTIVITHKNGSDAVPTVGEGAPDKSAEGQRIEEVPTKALLESGDPKWNVAIFPGDVIKVVPAGTFYVAGDVKQPGGFPLTDFDAVSAIQALAMAGGTTKTARLKDAVIIRRDAAGNRVEEKVDLKLAYSGKAIDAKLGANDILFVPGSVSKAAGLRAVEASIQVATGLLIFGL